MSDLSINDKVKQIIISILGINEDEYSDELAIGDIPEWDSINHVLLIQQIEEDFEISIDVTDAIDIEDVFDIISTLKKYNIS
jgi:acyl carrier protein